jgi:ATP-dependent helicase HrpB
VRVQAERLRELIDVKDDDKHDDRLGLLLGLAYPERIAKRREAGGNRYQLAGGTGAVLPKGSMLSREEYLAVGDVDGVGNEIKIFLAEPISEKDIRQAFSEQLVTIDEVYWDDRLETVIARQVTRFGTLELSEILRSSEGELVRKAMLEGIGKMGIQALPWNEHTVSVRTRSEWLRTEGLVQNDWPELSDERLMNTLDQWLGPYLDGVMKRSHLSRLNMTKILEALFSFEQLRELDRLAPTHLTVPTGSRIPVEYSAGARPVLAVRLQEMFGQTETPTVGGGKINVVLHLLSPAKRPLAVTQDLPSFWNNAYQQVRKDMRGRYPKHYWPESPLEAEPTRRTKRK